MREAVLSPRLRAIVDCIDDGGVVADIGCDHGLVACALAREGRAKRVVACDISGPSLQKAYDLARKEGLGGVVETRRGNGLEPLGGGEADAVVIAGMGGALIQEILTHGEEKARNAKLLVLGANRNVTELREWLAGHGYGITDETLVREDERYYHIICARNGQGEKEGKYFTVGRKLVEKRDPLLGEYLEKKIREYTAILEKASAGRNAKEYIGKLKGRIRDMEEVLECL